MSDTVRARAKSPQKAAARAALLVAFVVVAVYVVRFTPVRDYFAGLGVRGLGRAAALFVFSFFIPKLIANVKTKA